MSCWVLWAHFQPPGFGLPVLSVVQLVLPGWEQEKLRINSHKNCRGTVLKSHELIVLPILVKNPLGHAFAEEFGQLCTGRASVGLSTKRPWGGTVISVGQLWTADRVLELYAGCQRYQEHLWSWLCWAQPDGGKPRGRSVPQAVLPSWIFRPWPQNSGNKGF